MGKPVIAGNWKMHMTCAQARDWLATFLPLIADTPDDRELVVAPPFTAISTTAEVTSGSRLEISSQNVHWEGKRYNLNDLPDDLKELVRGMQVADAQLRMHEDTLKVLAVGRQSMAMQLNERLKNVTPMPEQG